MNLLPGNELILTQTTGFNFDTLLSVAPRNANYTVTVNGTGFIDDIEGHILTFNGADDGGTATQEAKDWVLLGQTTEFQVMLAMPTRPIQSRIVDANISRSLVAKAVVEPVENQIAVHS